MPEQNPLPKPSPLRIGPHFHALGYPLYAGSEAVLWSLLQAHLTAEAAPLANCVTLNPELAIIGWRDPRYRRFIEEAALVTCDGIGLQLAVRMKAQQHISRIAGASMVHPLCDLAARLRLSVALLGGKSESNRAACAALAACHPGLDINGFSPTVASDGRLEEWDRVALAELLSRRPVIVLTCFGAPKDGLFVMGESKLLSAAGVRFTVGLGGTVDFLSGRVSRAPDWIQRLGLEWLHRTVVQPARIGRLFRNVIPFFWQALRH
ncbi:WecB/TagA/CpsF family glycosyltransferase [Sphingosinicella soli]|uniref:N-acetylglucosaminyldiphosphoundecaprenol N-acetyl-beta-D-mannosaminyltransferase n=1 Tax=Sphingosinicella soli TaxID=333708 RepID=A0A7W7B0G3_9SPHN|nr:WecB/TagA/CpsF family glycosyltransferase [Sphingosinicella soli]MBB4631765.1 N-acetylglucosaminyldiphosphoundecaprenol N-acetyl-beta-D-mannosaminyltransferase [Sphingosinicella soli]